MYNFESVVLHSCELHCIYSLGNVVFTCYCTFCISFIGIWLHLELT